MKPRFTRAGMSRTSELDDNPGQVTITIRLTRDGGRVVPGNLTRTISVKDSTVTDVANAIHVALFNGK